MNRDDLKGLKHSQAWVKEQIDKYLSLIHI